MTLQNALLSRIDAYCEARGLTERQAATNALLSTQLLPEWCEVKAVGYQVHAKEGKPPSMRVTYQCGLRAFSEWVCIEHSGYARQKAVSWWRQRSDAEIPNTTAEAVACTPELRTPAAIQVRQVPGSKHPDITAVRFA